MLAFSNDYYGFIFRVTQSVELFCTYNPSVNALIFVSLSNFSILFKDSAALSISPMQSPILDTAFFNFSESVPALSIFPIFFSDFSLQ